MTLDNIKFNTEEAAGYLDLSPRTLKNWRYEDKGPAYYKPSDKIYYYKMDLDKWIKGDSDE